MERREFLKILGLTGVAMTLPKPLGIVSAKMADLKSPPLHVGHCLVGPLADADRGFAMHRISIGLDRTIPRERREDYYGKWVTSVFEKYVVGDKACRRLLVQIPSWGLPDPYGPAVVSEVLCDMRNHYFMPGESLEFYFTPRGDGELPKFPLPKLTVMLHGYMIYKKEHRRTGLDASCGGATRPFAMVGAPEAVQLERAKAIELGLISAAEPEGIIV